MRNLLYAAALVVFSLAAQAQDGDALLTPDGTLYMLDVEAASEASEGSDAGDASAHLVLTTRRGSESAREIVPATRSRGQNTYPSIAYDSQSGMLFVFWVRCTGLLYNELLLTTRSADGVWSTPTELGPTWDFREGLRIAVTRKVTGAEGQQETAVSVHAVWWEFKSSTGRQSARYAMLSIENGAVASVDELDLSEFVVAETTPDADVADPDAVADDTILKRPLLFTSAAGDNVLIMFGDLETRSMHRVRVRPTLPPVSDGRIRIPVGRREGGSPAPRFPVAASARVDGIYGDDGHIALYAREDDLLRYIVMKNGEWSSESRSIALDAQVTSGAAVDALRRLLHEH